MLRQTARQKMIIVGPLVGIIMLTVSQEDPDEPKDIDTVGQWSQSARKGYLYLQ